MKLRQFIQKEIKRQLNESFWSPNLESKSKLEIYSRNNTIHRKIGKYLHKCGYSYIEDSSDEYIWIISLRGNITGQSLQRVVDKLTDNLYKIGFKESDFEIYL